MSPAGAVIALTVCLLVALLAQRHGRDLGRNDLPYVRKLRRERDELVRTLELTVDAFDSEQARAERWFAAYAEAEAARYVTAQRLAEAEQRPSRIVATSAPRLDRWGPS